jgi:hypothetical protein
MTDAASAIRTVAVTNSPAAMSSCAVANRPLNSTPLLAINFAVQCTGPATQAGLPAAADAIT